MATIGDTILVLLYDSSPEPWNLQSVSHVGRKFEGIFLMYSAQFTTLIRKGIYYYLAIRVF